MTRISGRCILGASTDSVIFLTSKPAPGHKIYPYLLGGMKIIRPNQVWAVDITCIPMTRGFLYLVAIIDVYSRHVLSWRLSNTLSASVSRPWKRRSRRADPDIFNTDQGAQFTCEAFTGLLQQHGVRISMDGKRSYNDNLFIELLSRIPNTLDGHSLLVEESGEIRALGNF